MRPETGSTTDDCCTQCTRLVKKVILEANRIGHSAMRCRLEVSWEKSRHSSTQSGELEIIAEYMPRKKGPRKSGLAVARMHFTMVWEKMVLVQLINHCQDLASGQVTEAALYS